MINKIKNALLTVENILIVKPALRNSDNRLIANYWAIEIGAKNLEGLTAQDFLKLFSEGKLTPPESITRARRKVQEENPALQGEVYKKRHQNAKDVQRGINE